VRRPAGSGKTTTLVARIAWLVDGGVDPATIAAITFNRRAADSGPTEAQRLVRDVYSALADMEMERAPAGKLRPATAQTIGRSSLERLSSALARPQALFARVDRVM
jgi:superfamily I DNA/RNA helicase